MLLDDETYELLGYSKEDVVEKPVVAKRILWLREVRGKEWRDSPQGRKQRKDARVEFMQTAKGKEMRARAWAKYYAKNREKLIEKNRQRRKASK